MIRNNHRLASLTVAALTILATLALAPAASATFPARNGLIAFHAQIDDGIQIFTIRPNGHDLRQITNVDGDATDADWSPDGRRIAFTFNECSVGIMDADGSDLSLIADDSSMCQSDPSFTPDGTRLVFGHFDWLGTGLHEIWSMKPDGSDKRVVTGAGETDPNVSPDGRRLSFKDFDVGALWVQNMDGSGLVQVSPIVSVAYKHDWAPDGRHLVFSDNSRFRPDRRGEHRDRSTGRIGDGVHHRRNGARHRLRRLVLARRSMDRLAAREGWPVHALSDAARRFGAAPHPQLADLRREEHRLGTCGRSLSRIRNPRSAAARQRSIGEAGSELSGPVFPRRAPCGGDPGNVSRDGCHAAYPSAMWNPGPRLLKGVLVVVVASTLAGCGMDTSRILSPEGCTNKTKVDADLHVDPTDDRWIWATHRNSGAAISLRLGGGYGVSTDPPADR